MAKLFSSDATQYPAEYDNVEDDAPLAPATTTHKAKQLVASKVTKNALPPPPLLDEDSDIPADSNGRITLPLLLKLYC
jgi:hypothetical protein